MIFFQTILPLFALIGAGYILGRYRRTDVAGLTDVCLYILLPVLLFGSLVKQPVSGLATAQICIYILSLALLYWGGIYLLARMLGWDNPTRSAVTLSLTSINAASYGLPIALFAFGDEALSAAMLLVVVSNIYNCSLAVYIAAGGRQKPIDALRSVFKLPLIYAVTFAFSLNALQLRPPEHLLDLMILVGKAGPQVALIVLGIQISTLNLRGNGSIELYGGILVKSFLAPFIGIGIALAINAQGMVRDVLFLYSCLPTAINALLLSIRMDARSDLVGGIIFGTTLLSPIAITIILFWLGK